MINEYTIYGERHSGTNLMQRSMDSFFPAVSFNERYGGKHWFGFSEEIYLRFSNHLFLCCTRNPYDWILSFYAYPHCIPIRNLQSLENFLFNVSRHQLVPKHRILSKTETQNLLNLYNCNIKNLPTIKRDDAQAKYIGLKPKQVCEIIVNNVTSGITKKYRLCVN